MQGPLLIALGAAVLVAGCASNGTPAPAASSDPVVERAQRFAQRRCAGCHAIGLDEMPAASAPRFRDLRMRFNAISLQKRFADISQHGVGEMPPIEITRSEAEDLVVYFESLGER